MKILNKKKLKELEVVANRFRKDLLRKTTKSELRFKVYLLERKVKFEEQYIVYRVKQSRVYNFFICDFYLPKYRTIVEIDGKHHENKDQLEYDKQRTLYLKELGYKVIRLANDETIDREDIRKKLSFIR